MIDTKELRQLAQAATPGGWYVKRGNYIYGCKEVTDGEEKWHPVIACTDDDEVNVNFEANAAFIAAANPAAVSEILDRLEAAEKDVARKEKVIDALGSTLNAMTNERDALRTENAALVEDMNLLRNNNMTLRAKIARMEKQEPVGKFIQHPSNGLWEQDGYGDNPEASPLYALPGAQGEEK